VQSLVFNSPTFAKNPASVALSGNLVFWSNFDLDNNFAASSIGRAGKGGTPPPSASFMPFGQPLAPFWLAADDSHLYFAFAVNTISVEIFRANLDGSDSDGVVEGFPAGGIAVDAGKLYWANSAEQTISRANTDGTDPEFAFITNTGEQGGLAVDGGIPSNEFAVGTLTRDKQHGTATVELSAGDPGTFSLSGTGLKPATADVDGGGSVTVPIGAAGKAKNQLKRNGKVKLAADVTFTAIGNATPTSQQVPVKLVRKR
jgi:hypothetical protein